MFAPQTINIRYGNPVDTAVLAGAAGQAQNNMDLYKQQYAGYMQKIGLDQQFLEDQQKQSLEDAHFKASLQATQGLANNKLDQQNQSLQLQQAYNEARLNQKANATSGYQAIDQEKVDAINNRQAAQASGGVGSATGRGRAPLDLVDANGNPYQTPSQPGVGIIQNTDTGEVTQNVGNQFSDTNAEGNVLEGPDAAQRIAALDAQATTPGSTGTPQTRQQYMQNQRLAATRDNLEYKEGAIADRAANRPAPKTYEQKQDEKYQAVYDQTQAIQSMPPANKIAWAKRDVGGAAGAFMTDDDALAHFTMAASNAKAVLGISDAPTTNSNGSTPSGGNAVQLPRGTDPATIKQGAAILATLPSKTWYVDNRGNLAQKP